MLSICIKEELDFRGIWIWMIGSIIKYEAGSDPSRKTDPDPAKAPGPALLGFCTFRPSILSKLYKFYMEKERKKDIFMLNSRAFLNSELQHYLWFYFNPKVRLFSVFTIDLSFLLFLSLPYFFLPSLFVFFSPTIVSFLWTVFPCCVSKTVCMAAEQESLGPQIKQILEWTLHQLLIDKDCIRFQWLDTNLRASIHTNSVSWLGCLWVESTPHVLD